MEMESARRRLQQLHSTLKPESEEWERVVVLPDNVEVTVTSPSTTPTAHGTRRIAIENLEIIEFHDIGRHEALLLSAIGTPYENDNPVPKNPVLELSTPEEKSDTISVCDFWGCIYGLWTLFHTQEHIPIVLSSAIPNAGELAEYVLYSGLGRKRLGVTPLDKSFPDIFLSRAAFWQGAGGGPFWHDRGWLPGKYSVMTSTFPSIQSFTRSPLVITAHPLRPPKPPPKSCVYKRFCTPVGKMLTFHMIDADDELHMETFHRWHNDERVHRGWGERGTMEYHKEYVRKQTADPHSLPMMMSWDGDLMGYIELVWIKENHIATFVPEGAKDHDRGLHLLVGEAKYRGAVWSQCWMRSVTHYLFLADPRTERIIGEPKRENGAIIKVSTDAGMHLQTSFDFPYKRSVMTMNLRDRWFKEDMLL